MPAGSLLHEGIFLHGLIFARRVTIAWGDIFARRHFCTATFLYVETFTRRNFSHNVTFVWRHFWKASYLQGVLFLQKYLCTAKFISNLTILNGASLFLASFNNLIKLFTFNENLKSNNIFFFFFFNKTRF